LTALVGTIMHGYIYKFSIFHLISQ